MPTGLLFGERSNDTAIVSLSSNQHLYYDTNRPIRAPCVRSNAPISRKNPSLPLGEFELDSFFCCSFTWQDCDGASRPLPVHPIQPLKRQRGGAARHADLTRQRDADTQRVKRPGWLSLLFTADIFTKQSLSTGVVLQLEAAETSGSDVYLEKDSRENPEYTWE